METQNDTSENEGLSPVSPNRTKCVAKVGGKAELIQHIACPSCYGEEEVTEVICSFWFKMKVSEAPFAHPHVLVVPAA